jgi:hypothetical protein
MGRGRIYSETAARWASRSRTPSAGATALRGVALVSGLLLLTSVLAACGTASHASSEQGHERGREPTVVGRVSTTASTTQGHTSTTATASTPTAAKVSTTKPRPCALLTLKRARALIGPTVIYNSKLADNVECSYNTPEPYESEAKVSLQVGSHLNSEAWAKLLAEAQRVPMHESVSGLGERAVCFAQHIQNSPHFPTDIVDVAFVTGSASVDIIVETRTVGSCAPVVALAREIESSISSAPTQTSSHLRASPVGTITAQNGPCYLPPASAAAVTGVPMFIEAQRGEQEQSACAYTSESKHVLLNLSTGSALINQGENGEACAESQVGTIRKIPNGCLIFSSSDPGDPDAEILSVSINGKPAVTFQYQGPNGQSSGPVSGRLERAALVVGEHLAAGG